MTIEKVIEYVLHTPYNTNKNILRQMLKDLIRSHGGNVEEPDAPDVPDIPDVPGGDGDDDVIYDGGIEA